MPQITITADFNQDGDLEFAVDYPRNPELTEGRNREAVADLLALVVGSMNPDAVVKKYGGNA